jgi:hypothetical protein
VDVHHTIIIIINPARNRRGKKMTLPTDMMAPDSNIQQRERISERADVGSFGEAFGMMT